MINTSQVSTCIALERSSIDKPLTFDVSFIQLISSYKYQCIYYIHLMHAKVFSSKILHNYFSQFILRVCTLVYFIYNKITKLIVMYYRGDIKIIIHNIY